MIDKIKVIDNFLSNEDFDLILKIADKIDIGPSNKIVLKSRLSQNLETESNTFEKEIKKISEKFHNTYHNIAFNILKELSPKKASLYTISDFSIVVAGKDFNYPIHTDAQSKLLSGVIYIAPKNNIGTTLYNSKKERITDIEWKQNRALFFSRTDTTFHSYKSDGISKRITLVYSLRTEDLLGVFKAESIFWPINFIIYKMNVIFKKLFSN